MNYTQEQVDEFILASESVHYFASLCLPQVYKQQTHLLDTYVSDENELSIVARQIGNTTIQAIFVLWRLIFKSHKTTCYTSYNMSLCENFINKIIDMNDKLPEHIKAEFTAVTRYTLTNKTNSRVLARPMNSNSLRGLSVDTLIVDLFHFLSKKNLSDFLHSSFPVLAARSGKLIMSTNINPNGFKLYEFFNEFNIYHDCGISVIPFNKCTHYSELKASRLKQYLSTEHYLSEYCCIDREGIDYAK